MIVNYQKTIYLSMESKAKTHQILKIMHILTWIAVIGLIAQAGAILISFAVSCFNPEAARNLYTGMDLEATRSLNGVLDMYNLRQYSFRHYAMTVSFLLSVSFFKAYVLFLVTKTLSKVNLTSPFNFEVAHLIQTISYFLFSTWLIAVIGNGYTSWLVKRTEFRLDQLPTSEFLFMAGLVFIISQIFKRGVEMQTESELTV